MRAPAEINARGALGFLAGGGATGALIRSHDWEGTPLGPLGAWPLSLRSALSICLQSSFPTAIYWGPDLRLLYNDAWAQIPAERHPWALGRPGAEVWADIWHVVGPQLARVVETGEGFSTYDAMLPMVRAGTPRETYWNYSFTPIRGEDGSVVGVFNQGHETTDRVVRERRDRFLLELSDRLRTLSDPRAVIDTAQEALGRHLNASRVGYGEIAESARTVTTESIWTDGSVPPREGTRDLAAFGPVVLDALRSGVPLLVADVARDPRTAARFAAFDAIDIRAVIAASLVKDGHVRAALYVHAREPRPWTEQDAELVTEVAERTWSAVERARAEAALLESERELQELADSLPVLVAYIDRDERYRFANRAYDAWFPSLGRKGMLGSTVREVLGDTAYQVVQPRIAAVLAGERVSFDQYMPYPQTAHRYIRVEYLPRLGATSEVDGFYALVQDITAAKRAEAALLESESRFREMADHTPAMIWVTDPSGACTYLNPRWYEFTGQSPGRGEGFGWLDAIHPEDRPLAERAFRTANAERRNYRGEFRLRRADGVYRWVIHAAAARLSKDGEHLGYVGSLIDIDERREMEMRLQEANERLEERVAQALAERNLLATIVETTEALVQVLDPDYRWLAINSACVAEYVRIFGKQPKVGESLLDLLAHKPDEQAATRALWARALAGEAFTHIGEFGDAQIDRRVYEMKFEALRAPDGRQTGAFLTGRDITERVREQERLAAAESQLRQAQKMEAVGQLTGGVAHDFNNLLTIIKSSTDFLRRPDLSDDRRRRYIDAISDTVDRAAKLTGQLLAFARRQALAPEVFDAAERVRGIIDMLRTIVGARVRIATAISCETCFIEADLSQFETALVNMAVNARDAMDGEGTLTIGVAALAEMPAIRGQDKTAGGFVAVSLTDTGVGIPADRLVQIFEPFYTTKEVGKGTGLGLSQVYGFAKQSGGDVDVASEPGSGARFTLYLPRISAVPDRAAPQDEQRGPHSDAGGGRRVLVVEDNAEVGNFATQLLSDLGYETAWAANAGEALSALAESEAFDVVFTDVVMPGMTGVELGQEIRRRYPGLPVVLTSGYSHVLAEEGRHGFELLQKPYAVDQLSMVLRRVMKGPRKRLEAPTPADSSRT